MSVTVVRYLHCDLCGEPFDTAPDPENSVNGQPGAMVKEQRKMARKEGWTTGLPGGCDLCSDCRLINDPTEEKW